MTTLIKNGTVVSTTGRHEADVLIDGEKIAAILQPGTSAAVSAESGAEKVIDAKGKYVFTPGVEGYYQQQFASSPLKMNSMRFAVGAGYDCADMKFGYMHWGGRWVFPWTDQLLLDIGLGPSLIFRESWKNRFAELVADEEGFWAESDEFLPGYQYKWLIGGNLELQYEFATNWHAYWAVVPAINILVINSMGVKYSF